MPDGADDVYSSPQINIPPTFPFILKQYAKAAIRTQPYDLLKWSASYFRALAKGETPPIKDRLEYPPPDTPSGLSPGYLKVLIKQIGKGGFVTVDQLLERWNGICLAEGPLHEMLAVGHFGDTLDWLHFVAVAAGFLCSNLTQTMVLLCHLLTDEPEGGSALIPLQLFSKLYSFLAGLNCGNPLEEDDDDNKREYILPDGPKIDGPHPFPLQREGIEPCVTDSSIFLSDFTSSSTDQLFVTSHKPLSSMQVSPIPTPCNTPPSPVADRASTSTLTPETNQFQINFEGSGAQKENSEGAALETFYDSKLKGSHVSSQENIADEGNLNKKLNELCQEAKDSNDDTSHDPLGAVMNCELVNSLPERRKASSESVVERSPVKTDLEENQDRPLQQSQEFLSKSKMKEDDQTPHTQDVPGIGPVVDQVQVQAVLDYLKGMSQKQGGMVKPGNIRHFLCPPLEKVPASQKTKV